MADAKISALTENTTLNANDLLPLVDDPAGTPATQKTKLQTLADWLAALSQTLTNKTITSPTVNTPTLVLADTSPTADGSIGFDRTGEDLQIGDGSASQVVHIGAWTSWTPSGWVGFSSNPETPQCYYTIIGKTCICSVVTGSGTSNATGFSLEGPFTPITRAGFSWIGYGQGYDNTSTYVPNLMAKIDSNDASIVLTQDGGTGGWTASGSKSAVFTIIYEIA